MKDIIITSKRIKSEIRIFAVCFIIAFIINIVAIIIYKTHWVEVFSQIGFVTVIAFSLYMLLLFLRIIFYLIRRLFKR